MVRESGDCEIPQGIAQAGSALSENLEPVCHNGDPLQCIPESALRRLERLEIHAIAIMVTARKLIVSI